MRIDSLRLPPVVFPNFQPGAKMALAKPAPSVASAQVSKFQNISGKPDLAALIGVPTADEFASMVGSAKASTFNGKRVERGPHASEAPSAGLKKLDADSSHPLYGRYLQQWQREGGAANPGEQLLQLFQSRLTDLKSAVRSIR